jgi:hypothetical protein
MDMDTMTWLNELPISVVSDAGAATDQNHMDVDVVDGKLRLYLAPDLRSNTMRHSRIVRSSFRSCGFLCPIYSLAFVATYI